MSMQGLLGTEPVYQCMQCSGGLSSTCSRRSGCLHVLRFRTTAPGPAAAQHNPCCSL